MSHQVPSLAIIGVSGYARLILHSLLSVLPETGAHLAAATVINRCAEEETCRTLESLGCRIYGDYTAMLKDLSGKLDLCLIPTGIPWHVEMCRLVLESGVNVLVEKPLAPNHDGALEIIRTADHCGRFVAVGFQSMYRQAHHEMKKWLHSGAIGRLKSVRAEGSWPRDRAYYSRNAWTGRLTQNGRLVCDSPLNNAFSHAANLSLFFAEAETGLCAHVHLKTGRLLRHYPIETYDSVQARLETENGLPLVWSFTHADSRKVNPRLFIEAEAGRFEWKFDAPACGFDASGTLLRKWSVPEEESMRRDMMRQVIGSLRGGDAPLCSSRSVLPHARIVAEIARKLPIRNASPQADPWAMHDGVFSALCGGGSIKLTALEA